MLCVSLHQKNAKVGIDILNEKKETRNPITDSLIKFILIHYQTTNFRLVQIETVCRQQF